MGQTGKGGSKIGGEEYIDCKAFGLKGLWFAVGLRGI